MTNTYLLAVQTASKTLKSIIKILDKAQTWATQNQVSEDHLLGSALAKDMFPLSKQIQIISDNAKGMASRFSGVENLVFEDNEKSFQELIERLEKTISFIDAIPAENFDEAESRKIIMPYFKDKFQTSEDYLRDYALPNFYFHVVTAYAILRNQGVDLGKMDYINSLNLQDL